MQANTGTISSADEWVATAVAGVVVDTNHVRRGARRANVSTTSGYTDTTAVGSAAAVGIEKAREP